MKENLHTPPDPKHPANDHADDRFDVSDEFYYESNFYMGIDRLNLRTG